MFSYQLLVHFSSESRDKCYTQVDYFSGLFFFFLFCQVKNSIRPCIHAVGTWVPTALLFFGDSNQAAF